MDRGAFLHDDESALKLAEICRVQAEVGLQRQIHFYILGYIHKGSTRPHGTIQCGKLVIFDWNNCSKIFTEQIRILFQTIFDAQEYHTLFFKMLLN